MAVKLAFLLTTTTIRPTLKLSCRNVTASKSTPCRALPTCSCCCSCAWQHARSPPGKFYMTLTSPATHHTRRMGRESLRKIVRTNAKRETTASRSHGMVQTARSTTTCATSSAPRLGGTLTRVNWYADHRRRTLCVTPSFLLSKLEPCLSRGEKRLSRLA